MTDTPKEITIDCSTGIVTERLLTDDEMAQIEVARLKYEEESAEKDAQVEMLVLVKESAKAKLIAGEPLTEEEAGVMIQ